MKFIFATTEIRKVPVTILSRCMRFDLRRVPADIMHAHLVDLLGREGIAYEPEALAMIVRAGEGSVRDNQSLLDQAISHGAGETGIAAVYAALACERSAGVVAEGLPASHREGGAVPGILRTMDLTHAIGLLAPRRVALLDGAHGACPWARQAYQILGLADCLLLAADRRTALDHVLKDTTP